LIAFSGCASLKGLKEATDRNAGMGASAPEEAESPAAEEAALTTAVEYISVVGDGNSVLIGTSGAVRYTVFRLTDPERLIVDLPGVSLDKVSAPLTVGNDFLTDITALSYGNNNEIGRIIIGVKEGVEHDIKSGENSILVTLNKAAVEAPSGEPLAEAGPAPVIAEILPEAGGVAALPLAEPVVEPLPAIASEPPAAPVEEPVKLPQATKILKIESSSGEDTATFRVVTDGDPTRFSSFELDTPARIVVDVWGVKNGTGKSVQKVAKGFIKAVRLGSHPDKVRLVFDSSLSKLPAHTVEKSGDSIILVLGAAAPAEEAATEVASAPAIAPDSVTQAPPVSVVAPPVEAPTLPETPAVVQKEEAPQSVPVAPLVMETAPQVEAVRIEKVEFKKVHDAGRLTVVASRKPRFTVNESEDGKTLAIDIMDAEIPAELARILDATKLKTPVESVTSYQESVEPRKAVRILVGLADKTPYAVAEENGVLKVEFMTIIPEPTAAQVIKGEDGEDHKVYRGKKIDLDMMDANISDVLRLLAEVSNLNVIASDDVVGQITLRLKGVPWDQAFDIILKSKDLDMVMEGNVVRVAPSAKLRAEREAALSALKAQEKLEDLGIRYAAINYSTALDLIPQVKGVLSDRGSVASDGRTNTLIIKDIKKGIEDAVELIARLDTPIPQVLIEARIVEASSSFARDLGIQWGLDYSSSGTYTTNTFGSSETSGQTGGTDAFAVDLPASGTAGTMGALGFIFGKAGTNPILLDLRLSAGEQEGRLKTISRPRITTMDNKEAKIAQGESIPFETTSSAGTSTMFVDADLSLVVTPHITPDGSVLMKIKASRNSIGTFRTSGGEPSINKKESSTEVLVRDGETTVIGGIVISDKSETDSGIPYLKDIPLLGWVFKSKSVSDTQTELLIFITPTIIKDKVVS
jgi:type IV pilus assembly protein PilQ